jgi:hypothetical protein
VKWYLKAAEHGLGAAQIHLGNCYANGKGVVKNDLLAYQWFLLGGWDSEELKAKLTAKQRAEGQRLATKWQVAFDKRRAEK